MDEKFMLDLSVTNKELQIMDNMLANMATPEFNAWVYAGGKYKDGRPKRIMFFQSANTSFSSLYSRISFKKKPSKSKTTRGRRRKACN